MFNNLVTLFFLSFQNLNKFLHDQLENWNHMTFYNYTYMTLGLGAHVNILLITYFYLTIKILYTMLSFDYNSR